GADQFTDEGVHDLPFRFPSRSAHSSVRRPWLASYSAFQRSYEAWFLVRTRVCGDPLVSVFWVRSHLPVVPSTWDRRPWTARKRYTCSFGSRRNGTSAAQSAHLHEGRMSRAQSFGATTGASVNCSNSAMQWSRSWCRHSGRPSSLPAQPAIARARGTSTSWRG